MSNLITPEDAGQRLNISRSKTFELLRSGALKGVKIGRFWRVREDDLAEYIANLQPVAVSA